MVSVSARMIVFLAIVVLFTPSLASGKVPKQTPELRIIGGHSVYIQDYPYQVAVLYRGQHQCGGSLIQYNYVLTAAHCVYDGQAKDFSVRAGSSIKDDGGVVLPVVGSYAHPHYDKDTYQNDVAVLKLINAFFPSSGVKPIELAGKNDIVEPGTLGAVTGWGRISEDGPFPERLQEVDLPVTTDEYCRSRHTDTQVDAGMFCAGFPEGQKDTCRGDSGGPFVVNGIQYGITSWGDECGKAESPGVYAKISYYRDFIDAVIEES